MPLLLVGLLVVLLGFAAFAIDVGQAYFVKRHLQASADAAALAGAQELPDISSATGVARTFGADGKNPPQGEPTDVQMDISTRCIKSAPGCSPANAVVVKESSNVKTHFAGLFGIDSFSVRAQATACSPCGSKPLDVMLVLDRTGSMCQGPGGSADCTDLKNAQDGMKTFLGLMDPDLDHVGLAVLPPAPDTTRSGRCGDPTSYSSRTAAYVVVPLSDDYLLDGKLNTGSDLVSTIDCVQGKGSTAYAVALEQAQAELDRSGRPGVQKVMVFLSDGAANTGPQYLPEYPPNSPYRTTPCHQGVDSAHSIAGSGTIVYSIGYDVEGDICQGFDPVLKKTGPELPAISAEDALRGIASEPDNYYAKPDPGQLNTIFTRIAADILHGSSKLVDDNA